MSFRKFGGLQYSAKHNSVSSYYNTSNNLQATTIGQPNTYINVESDLSGNFTTNTAPSTPDAAMIEAAIQAAVQEALKNWKPNSTFTLGDGTSDGTSDRTTLNFDINGILTQSSYTSYIPNVNNIITISLGSNVTGISYAAFKNLLILESISIPKSVTSIIVENNLFLNVPKLMSITVDSGNINYSSDSNGILFNKNNTRLIAYPAGRTESFYTIPNTVRTIVSGAFNTVSKMTSLTIPSSVTTLGQSILAAATIDTVIFAPGSQLTSITASAFAGATNLKKINIPPSVISIGDSAFQSSFAGVKSSTSITIDIPSSVISIGASAFQGAINLESVNFAEKSQVTSIGASAFQGATSLSKIDIPSLVTSIGASAFQGATGLKSATFAANAKSISIGANAFRGATFLDLVTFAENSQNINIDNTAFTNCLQTINVKFDSLPNLTYTGFYASDSPQRFCGAPKVIISCPQLKPGQSTIFTLPNNKTITVDISGNLTNEVFQNLDDQYYIDIDNITCISVGSDVTRIGSSAFQATSTNSSNFIINIPNTAINIDASALNSTRLTSIYVAPSNINYSSLDGVLFNKIADTLIQYPVGNTQTSYTVPNTLPNNVTSIVAANAFQGAINLTSITIPASIKTIGTNAFTGSGIKNVVFDSSGNLYANFPIYKIGLNNSFYGVNGVTISVATIFTFQNLTTQPIDIPINLTWDKYYSNVLQNFSDITSVSVGSRVTTISQNAFASPPTTPQTMSSLTSINIPYLVTDISLSVFWSIPALKTITVDPDNNTIYSSLDGVLFNQDQSVLMAYPAGNNRISYNTIPKTVTTIKDYAFKQASNLTSLTIPSTVNTLGSYIVSNAYKLTTIEIGSCSSQLTSIGDFVFAYATGLTSINIPNTVTSIGEFAFQETTILASIFIPNSVASIDSTAFTNSGLTSVIFDNIIKLKTPSDISILKNPQIFCGTTNEVIISIKSTTFTINNETTTPNITAIDILTNLSQASYSSSTSPIFIGKNTIQSVLVGSLVTNIEANAFSNTTLESIIIPRSVTNIDPTALNSTPNLKTIQVEPLNGTYSSVDGVLFNKITNTLIQYPVGNPQPSYAIPQFVTNIEANAFQGASNLTSITVETDNTVFSSVDGVLFNKTTNTLIQYPPGNTRLSYNTIPNTVTKIGVNAFQGATYLTSITIPKSVTSIDPFAFTGSGVKTVIFEILSNLTSIGLTNGFSSGPNNPNFCGAIIGPINISVGTIFTLNNGTIPQTFTTKICDIRGTLNQPYPNPSSLGGYITFTDIVSVSVGTNVTSIGQLAFNGAANLKSISMPDTVISIGENAFWGTSLTLIKIPKSVKSIGDSAFQYATNLTEVHFDTGSQLISIGNQAFYGANLLQTITIPKYVISIGDSAFNTTNEAVSSLTSINVDSDNSTYSSDGVALFDKTTNTLIQYPNGNPNALYTIPNPVPNGSNTDTTIGAYAFQGKSNLRSIIIPASVTHIVSTAFNYSDITTVILENSTSLTTLNLITGSNQSFYGAIGPVTISVGTTFTLKTGPTPQTFDLHDTLTIPTGITLTDILTVSLGTNVKSIAGVFKGATALTTVTFAPSSQVISIGESAFEDATALTSINIPNFITSIGKSAFKDATDLTLINIPNLVTTIGESAFENAATLTNVNFNTSSSQLTTIGPNAFKGAKSLQSITIPALVDNIDPTAFSLDQNEVMSSLTSITVDPNNITYSAVDGVLFNIITHTLFRYPSGKTQTSYAIPASVTIIGAYAFQGASSLTSITIPESVASIGAKAFQRVSSLTSITIPKSVTYIGTDAFTGSGLTTVIFEILANLKTLGAVSPNNTGFTIDTGQNFYGATPVTVSIGTTFTLQTGTTPQTITTQIIDIHGSLILENYGINKANILTVSVGTNVTSIGDNAFNSATALTTVTFESWRVINIGKNAFYNASQLMSINIPKSVQTIGKYAFLDAAKLAEVTFVDPDQSQLISIGNQAFYSANKLQTITIPKRVTSIGDQVFTPGPGGVSSLTSIIVDSDNSTYSSDIYGVLFDIDKKTLIQYPNGNVNNYYIIPNKVPNTSQNTVPIQVTSIGAQAFQFKSNLRSITIPASVTHIDPLAFYASDITTVIFENPSNLKSLGDAAIPPFTNGTGQTFYGKTGVNISVLGQTPTILTFQDGTTQTIAAISGTLTVSISILPTIVSVLVGTDVTSIGYQAFQDASNLESITISNRVVEIEANAFRGATNLTTVTFAQDSQLDSIGSSAFSRATSLRYIIIPSTVTRIDDNAFYYTQSLRSINIPKNVKSIGSSAFNGASSLTTVIFAPNVFPMKIGDYAFASTNNLLSITIPKNVKSIESHAFNYSQIKTVVFESITNLTGFGFSIGPGQSFYEANNYVDIFGPAQPWTTLTMTDGTTKTINISGPLTQGLLQSSVSNVYDIALVSIGTNVTSIGNSAFVGANLLRSITIPASVTSIGQFAFQYVNSLKTVMFAQDSLIASIGNNAFMNAAGLTSIIVPASVTSIGQNAFNGASNLTTVTFVPGSLLTSIGGSAFAYTQNLRSITIPVSVNAIDSTAFINNSVVLSTVVFESLITFNNLLSTLTFTIGPGQTFCSAMNVTISVVGPTPTIFTLIDLTKKYVNISGDLTPASYNNNNIDPFKILSVSVGINVTSIGEGVFSSPLSKLTSITIPGSVTSIGNYAFNTVSNLNTVTFVPASLLKHIGNYAFASTGITSITIPEFVESIGNNAFYSCTGITSITIPASVTSIGNNAFDSAIYLATVTFATGSLPLSIGASAFKNTKFLHSITIPDNVTIGSDAFVSSALTTVTFVTKTHLKSLGDIHGFTIGPGQTFYGKTGVTILALDFSLKTTPSTEYFYSSSTVSRDTTGYTRCDVLLVGVGGFSGFSYEPTNQTGIYFGGAGGGGASASFTNITCNPFDGHIEFEINTGNPFFFNRIWELNNWKLNGNPVDCNLVAGNGGNGDDVPSNQLVASILFGSGLAAPSGGGSGGVASGSANGLPSGTVKTISNGTAGSNRYFWPFPYTGDPAYSGGLTNYPFLVSTSTSNVKLYPNIGLPLPAGGAPVAIENFTPPSLSPDNNTEDYGHGSRYQKTPATFYQDGRTIEFTLEATEPGAGYIQVKLYNP